MTKTRNAQKPKRKASNGSWKKAPAATLPDALQGAGIEKHSYSSKC